MENGRLRRIDKSVVIIITINDIIMIIEVTVIILRTLNLITSQTRQQSLESPD